MPGRTGLLDFILIYSYQLDSDGSMPGVFEDRLAYGLQAYQRGVAQRIIVAGKCGDRDREWLTHAMKTHASVMKDFLTSNGVPPTHVIEEACGENTFDCTRNAYAKIILPNEWTAGLIVSSEEHLPRVILQTARIIPPGMTLWYGGPRIPDPVIRAQFCAHEQAAIDYAGDREY